MIQLDHNSLGFSFPHIDQELAQKVREYSDQRREAFTASFHELAKKKIEANRDASHEGKSLDAALERLASLRDSEIHEAWMAAWSEVARRSQSRCNIAFQRTLRLPDDGNVYPLPAGLGAFPLRPVDCYPSTSPAHWLEKGGVLLPMYQAEALWLSFNAEAPLAMKITSGSVNALTGETDRNGLVGNPQNYLTIPDQPWLDGFKVSPNTVRQFVAMPVGSGFTASEQLAPDQTAGGMVIEVIPMKTNRLLAQIVEENESGMIEEVMDLVLGDCWRARVTMLCCRSNVMECSSDMGLGGGGKIQQEIYQDELGVEVWEEKGSIRLCVHICNSMTWRAVTGENPPHPPITAEEYQRHHIPWFDFYRDDLAPLPETEKMAGLKSVDEVATEKGLAKFTDGELDPEFVVQYGNARRPEEIREWGRSVVR